MTLEQLRSLCLSFPQVTEDIKWEDHLCFNIGGKMFLITSPDQVPVSASFKASHETFEALQAKPGFKPAAYLARYQWLYVDDISRLSARQWEQYAREAYGLVAAKLPAKIRRELAL